MLEGYGGQIVMVSHSRDEIYRFADELLVMDSGQILAQGKTQALFDDPGTAAVARMTGCKNIAGAERLDAHTLRIADWGIDLHLTRTVTEDVTAVGYRAHYFEPVWPGDAAGLGNCLPCKVTGMDELPCERRYYIEAAEPVCWFVQESERKELDERGTPANLRLKEEAILLLHD